MTNGRARSPTVVSEPHEDSPRVRAARASIGSDVELFVDRCAPVPAVYDRRQFSSLRDIRRSQTAATASGSPSSYLAIKCGRSFSPSMQMNSRISVPSSR